MTEFFRHLRHDLANRLGAVRMAVAQLASEPNAKDAVELRAMIDRELERALSLSDQLVEYGRARRVVRREPVDLEKLVADIAGSFPSLRVSCVAADEIDADPVALGLALRALLDNVARYAPEGDALIEQRVSEIGWTVSVSDAGPGFDANFEDVAFEPFHRGRDARVSHRHGTGIGLAIVDAVARAHGGRAWARARDGGGTVVSLSIPRPTEPVLRTH